MGIQMNNVALPNNGPTIISAYECRQCGEVPSTETGCVRQLSCRTTIWRTGVVPGAGYDQSRIRESNGLGDAGGEYV